MKKFTLLAVFISLGSLLSAQEAPMTTANGKNNRTGMTNFNFECLPGSVFSQIGSSFDQAFFCDTTYAFQKVADDYIATGPFSRMRFWGFNFYGGAPGNSQDFQIEFYNGDPSAGGTLVNSFFITAVPQPTAIFVFWMDNITEMYRIDVDFGTNVTQLSGWVTISRYSTDGYIFGWTGQDDAGNCLTWAPNIGYFPLGGMTYFCLGGSLLGNPMVPLSNWALFIGIALIGFVVILRYRRII